MTKTALIAVIANQLNVSKNMAKQMVDSTFEAIMKSVAKGNDVRIQGFGTFKSSKRAARKGVNPRTGAPLKIAATKVVSMKAGKELKKRVNK